MTLDELEKLEKAATPGPWHNIYHNRTESNALVFFTKGCDLLNDIANVIGQAPDGSSRHDANFEFIAAAREMLPKLIKVAKLVKYVRDIRDYVNSRDLAVLDKALAELEQP